MKNKFLYKPVGRIGILESREEDNNWMEDLEPVILEKQYTESTLEELIILLKDILKIGNPNYTELIHLFLKK